MLSKPGGRFDRVLGSWHTLSLSFGAMIGWSWIALIAVLMARGGSLGAVVATILAGAVIMVIGAVYAELAAAMPKAGGEHEYSLRALGRIPSFFCTWSIVFAYVSVVAFEAVALPTVMENLVPALGQGALWQVGGSTVFLDKALIGSGVALLITWINLRGVKVAAAAQLAVVSVILLAGLALGFGLVTAGEVSRLAPLLTDGWSGILAAMALVPFMMVGFDVIPQAAEEIRLPPRRIGLVLVGSIFAALMWYLMIELAVGLLLDAEARQSASLATVAAADAAFGQNGRLLLLLGGVAGIVTSWNGFLVGGSRALFAMAESGMMPAAFARLDPITKAPKGAILLIGGLGVLAPWLGDRALIWFVNSGAFGLMIAYIFVCWSFLTLRRQEPGLIRPFRVPAGAVLGWFGLLASVTMAALYMPGMPAALVWPQEWLMVGIWFAGGYGVYLSISRQRGLAMNRE